MTFDNTPVTHDFYDRRLILEEFTLPKPCIEFHTALSHRVNVDCNDMLACVKLLGSLT